MNINGSNSLLEIHSSHKGKVSDKWEIYLKEYDRLFNRFRNKNINLLELGIQNGGSLEIWAKYFSYPNKIIGCDINQKCLNLSFDNPKINIVVGDATLRETKERIFQLEPSFDIVIEDASHISNHIIKAFIDFFPAIKDDGLFIAEDLHCSYWEAWEGGLDDPYSSISFFKLLADIVNYEHWGNKKERLSIFNGFMNKYDVVLDNDLLSSIHSVEFINSMCVIKKSHQNSNMLGKRYVAGNIANIDPEPLSNNNINMTPSNETNNFWSNIEKHPSEQYLSLSQQIQDKEQQIQDKEQQIQDKEQQIQDKETHIQNQNAQIQHWHDVAQSMRIKNRVKRVIKKIVPSKVWKVLKYIKHNPNSLRLGLHVLKTQGLSALVKKMKKIDNLSEDRIANTYLYVEPILTNEVKAEIDGFEKKPLVSIVMPVYNVAPKWLDLAIKSIENQWYENWELCIADDKSTSQETIDYLKTIDSPKIKIKYLEQNGNISFASNEALTLTSGEYIVLMDNDDELTTDALYEVVKAINIYDADFIYSDEDKLEMDGSFSTPHFKPDFAPDMFLSQNYISHLGAIKKDLIDKVGGWEIGLEGSQDYDLYLKVLEHTDKIYHIQKVLYHWRKIPGSTAAEYGEKSYAQEAGRKSLENAMQRRNIKAEVINGLTAGTYKVNYKIIDEPLVSIIIPFKDKPELLKMCIDSILNKSTYKNFEIIGISNNSEEQDTFYEMSRLKSLDKRVNFYEYNVPFNYSDINNHAVKEYAKGEHLLFLNNDIEVITHEWIEELLMHSQREEVGAVGAKLFFPDKTIQHAGLVMAPYTSHSVLTMYSRHNKDENGYVSRAMCINNYSAVTAACMIVKKSLFEQFGGFDSENLKVAYNDVDFCLTLLENNFYNIFTPYSKLFHHESVSRGYERKLIDIERVEKEKYYLKEQHSVFFETDKFYNKNLSLYSVDSSYNYNNSIHYKAHIALPFEENIMLHKNCGKKVKNRICIFSHFDKNNIVDDYAVYYLAELSKIADIIFVSTAESLTDLVSIEEICRDIIIKENYGYDFSAWKSGLKLLGSELNEYKELILCNDSMFGPFFDLEPIFDEMQSQYDIWSMTDNRQITYHLQSYFVVYNKKAFNHALFTEFWEDFKIYIDKQKLIEMNEVKFSEKLYGCKDLKVGAYVSSSDLDSYLNITHYYWDELISHYKFPFIKKELLRDNPMNVDISNWQDSIKNNSKYNVDMIVKGLH